MPRRLGWCRFMLYAIPDLMREQHNTNRQPRHLGLATHSRARNTQHNNALVTHASGGPSVTMYTSTKKLFLLRKHFQTSHVGEMETLKSIQHFQISRG